jgi:uncharacterized membrane protein
MNSPLTPSPGSRTRIVLAVATASLLLLAALPALVGPPWRGVLMDVLAPLCHQLPERSFALAGTQLGLCHRCTALLLAMGVALMLPLALRASFHPGFVLVVALLPLIFDWGLNVAALWENTMVSRVTTGAWAGTLLGLMIGGAAGGTTRVARRSSSRAAP